MSAIMNYLRITPEQLNHLGQQPASVPAFVAAVQSVLWEEADAASVTPPYNRPVTDDLFLDIDKAWHALHFLLNGEAWAGQKPLWDAILGGTPFAQGVITEDRPGHFEADPDALWEVKRYLAPDEVSKVSGALTGLTESDLRGRFNISELKAAAIYPGNWKRRNAQAELSNLAASLASLAAFFQQAAQAGDALLIYLS